MSMSASSSSSADHDDNGVLRPLATVGMTVGNAEGLLDLLDYQDGSDWYGSSNTTIPTPAPTAYEQDPYYSNKWLLILPRVTAFISFFAVICVALEAWKDLAANRTRTTNQVRSTTRKGATTVTHVQFFYQIPLMCQVIAFALGSSAAPKGEVWGAIGNDATCTIQGAMFQFGAFGAILWDAVLSMTYLMMVRYKVGEMQLQRYKLYYHLFVWPPCLLVTLIPLINQQYNINGTLCWVESYPNNCETEENPQECIRGEGATVFQNLASLLTMVHLVYSFSVMLVLYCSIRGLENEKQRYTNSSVISNTRSLTLSRQGSTSTMTQCSVGTSSTSRRYSRAVGIQGMLYASGMLITSLPTPIYVVLWNTAGLWSQGFAIFATALLPLLGYVNFVIFMRNRSVAQCHTRYAKFLRRMHSCVFDYELYCQCHCWRKAEEDQAISVRGAAQQHNQRPRGPSSLDSQSANPDGALAPMPPVPENDDDELDGREGVPGPWTGFWINVKARGHQISQWVSELSQGSLADSEFDERYDQPPMQPTRASNRSKQERPPARPNRLVSEAPDLETIQEGLDQSSSTFRLRDSSSRLRDSSSRLRDSSSRGNTLRESDKEKRFVEGAGAEQAPCSIPTRYVSQVESSDEFQSPAPPNKPVRYISEVDSPEAVVRGGPLSEFELNPVPLGFISEIEMPEVDAGQQQTRHLDINERRAAPMTMPVRFVSEVEQPNAADYDDVEAPPSKPVRYVSEVEPPMSPVSNRSSEAETPDGLEPPSEPLRYKVEEQATKTKATKPARFMGKLGVPNMQAAPPSKPVRYISEVEAQSPETQVPSSSPLCFTNGVAMPVLEEVPSQELSAAPKLKPKTRVPGDYDA